MIHIFILYFQFFKLNYKYNLYSALLVFAETLLQLEDRKGIISDRYASRIRPPRLRSTDRSIDHSNRFCRGLSASVLCVCSRVCFQLISIRHSASAWLVIVVITMRPLFKLTIDALGRARRGYREFCRPLVQSHASLRAYVALTISRFATNNCAATFTRDRRLPLARKPMTSVTIVVVVVITEAGCVIVRYDKATPR